MKWTVTEEHQGKIVRDYLWHVQGFSRRLMKAIKYEGLFVNGESCTVRRKLCMGDEVEVTLPAEDRGAFLKPEQIALDIVYEDEEVLVINKPAGIATIPSAHHRSGTIANGILGYYESHNIDYTVHIVTRLDRDTSGLLLIAKHRYSHLLLFNDQKQGLVNRSYNAIVEGQLSQSSGTIDAPIGRREGSIIEREVNDQGQQAVTHYKVVEETKACSLLDINLETGRTHQIRVHFSYLGNPLVGDDLYGGQITQLSRQALHCKSLSFHHPTTKKKLTFHSQIPSDMKRVMDVVKRGGND